MVYEDIGHSNKPVGVHLVGSIPLKDAEEVFSTVAAILGDRIHRIPDGETGERKNWIAWQHQFLEKNAALEIVPPNSRAYVARPLFKLRTKNIHFDQFGYTDVAKASFAIFSQLKRAGRIPDHCRFQISLPTPLALIASFIDPQDRTAIEPAYEEGIFFELDKIMEALPSNEIAIQWDTAIEFAMLEGVMPCYFPDVKAGIIHRLIRLGNRVPAAVELGYHLCYGDAQHKHFKEPQDTSYLVELANAISLNIERKVNWIHMPVPRERTDVAYFAPLQNLRLQPETELYLGLVHMRGGVEGTVQRIEAAQQVRTRFGVATECGFGRRSEETIPELLRIHREVSNPIVK